MKGKKEEVKILNLGCGTEYRKGWVNLDINPRFKPDLLCDVEKGIPLKDNSVRGVYTKHVLEHLDPRKMAFVMSEIHRVCKPGSKVIIYCPYFSCSITYKSIDHISAISYYTFDCMPGFRPEEKKLFYFRKSFGYSSRVMTLVAKTLNPLLSFLPNLFPLVYERIFCWIFPMEEVKIVLRVEK